MLKFLIPIPLVFLLPTLVNAMNAIQASMRGLS